MTSDDLKIPKKQKLVTLWVHPEGRVTGSIFLYQQANDHAGSETPIEVLNNAAPFLVLERADIREPRFYNKRSIIRVEYQGEDDEETAQMSVVKCRLHMMEGTLLDGTIKEFLRPEYQRLFDYINRADESFVRIRTEQDSVCLVNKAYIVHITQLED